MNEHKIKVSQEAFMLMGKIGYQEGHHMRIHCKALNITFYR